MLIYYGRPIRIRYTFCPLHTSQPSSGAATDVHYLTVLHHFSMSC